MCPKTKRVRRGPQRAIFTLLCQLGLRGLHYQLLCTQDNQEMELQNRLVPAPAPVKKAIESWIEWSLQISDLVSVEDDTHAPRPLPLF